MLRRAFGVLAIPWAAVLFAATFAASRHDLPPVPDACALAVYLAGGLICHQRPERSFHLWATQMPVCARCTGIYLGGAAAAIGAFFASTVRPAVRLKPDPTYDGWHTWRRALVITALPTAITLMFEWTTGITPTNWTRALAGAPIGAAVVWLIAIRPEVN